MSEIQAAAIALAVEMLTKKHGWEGTEVRFKTPFGAVVTIKVIDDTITANVDDIGDVLTVPLSDPKFDTKISKIEAAITQNAEYAYWYARHVLKGPFPAGEAAIAKNTENAYVYAYNVLKGPFPAGEAAIAKDAEYAYAYAHAVLKLPYRTARNWRKHHLAKTKRKSAKKGKV